MKRANPVSDDAAERFACDVAVWQQVLGLGDWRIAVAQKRSTLKSAMAEVYKFDLEQRSATIRLGKTFGETPVTPESLKETALHEVLHVFLYELITTAQEQNADPDRLGSVEHRVINVLERLLADRG